MSGISLQSRAIIGEFYSALYADSGASWVEPLSMLFNSDQSSEEYNWLGQTPAMREWVGGRNAKGFSENSITIKNLHFEATLEALIRDLRRDKTGQLMVRIREMARRTNSHWASLLSTLIIDGATGVCYDGEYFFDTDHTEGNNTTNQSNKISTTIANLPTQVQGSTTAPSPEEAQQVIMGSISQIMGFKDNENEPMNENANQFLIMVPQSLYITFSSANSMPRGTYPSEQSAMSTGITVVANPRLSAASTFFTFRTDGDVSPFIRQQETEVQLKTKGEDSEHAFDNDSVQYGVDAWRNVGYGYWQYAVSHTMA